MAEKLPRVAWVVLSIFALLFLLYALTNPLWLLVLGGVGAISSLLHFFMNLVYDRKPSWGSLGALIIFVIGLWLYVRMFLGSSLHWGLDFSLGVFDAIWSGLVQLVLLVVVIGVLGERLKKWWFRHR